LSEEVLRGFRVGYAPKAWDRVLTGARRGGFSEAELLACGLASRARNGNLLDRFRERIMFPLADNRGRVLGFGARAMRAEQGAKYINTAENEIYKKGRQLFGIDRARAAIAKAGHAVVVEGYTDVLALHGAGIEETVGIMGTAVTQEQVAELARSVGADGKVSMALDADRSGQEAMLRAAKLAREREVQLRVVRMPEGKDPAELVQDEGGDALRKSLADSLSVLEFEVGRILEDADLDSPEGTDRALVAVRELIATAPPRSKVRDSLVRLAADRLDVPVDYVTSIAERLTSAQSGSGARAPAVSPHKAEITYLARCLSAGALGRESLERLIPEHLPSASLRRAREHLLAHPDDPQAAVPPDDADLAAAINEVVSLAEPMIDTDRDALRTDFLLLERSRLARELRRARSEDDRERQSELSVALQRVKTEMGTAMGQAS
jgi:DNA primase